MRTIKYPKKDKWEQLVRRPLIDSQKLNKLVSKVFEDIRRNGDNALKKYSLLYDKVKIKNLKITEPVIKQAARQLSPELKAAIKLAKSNIEKFHASQKEKIKIIETTKGVYCWRECRAIEKVGIYIPGGSAPLFSTVLMLAIPAKLAGCKEIILCTPPDKKGNINPTILYTAGLIGVSSIYSIGGIQAIGALTFGTQVIPKVDKIFGPGNQFVTAAKQLSQNFGVAIDMPAGPSEVLVIANNTCNPEFVAADLLSQAEHGADSQVVLLSDDEKIVKEVLIEMNKQLKTLSRKEIALQSLKNSNAIILKSINECIEFSNCYAPEHLIIAIKNANKIISKITNAGSVFLGNYSCESAGDYASGTNHTLPTNGYARNYSGVSLESFMKKITFQEISKEGLKNIGPSIELMAATEQLDAHKNAVTIRLKTLKK